MSTNMELITSVTVGSGGAASVTLPATGTIPQTYTDLKVLATARSTRSGSVDDLVIRFNGSSSNYTGRRLYGSGSSAVSDTLTDIRGFATGAGTTANTFSNTEFYIPNYTSSTTYKSVSVDAVNENNATESYSGLVAGLWSDNSAITTITLLANNGNLVEGSTFYLYGISNVTSTTKATGGIVSSDGNYNYHTFPFSGTFTPTENITADYLVIAGGGGGGYAAGGGGAGGYRTSIGGSALSLSAQAYTVTVGAGGTGGVGSGGVTSTQNTAGSNSVFSTITSSGGGRGASYDTSGNTGFTGGSGGGGGNGGAGGSGNSGSYSPSEGNNGGSGTVSFGGGGGGAGAVGGNGVDPNAGAGGAGSNSASAWAIATQTGANNGYYAGGGGGRGTNGGVGGLGGGGAGCSGSSDSGVSGIVNTGSGGGSGGNSPAVGGNGGSGLVIIRYAI